MSKLLAGLFFLCPFTFLSISVQGQKTARIDQPIASPTYVNLYWDASWDADNSIKQGTIDAVTRAIISSSYLDGLAEYGVVPPSTGVYLPASFAGGFLPDPGCPGQPPTFVELYDLVNVSIAGFIQCEHDRGPAVLRQDSVIYNVILPQSTLAREFTPFGWLQFCTGPSPFPILPVSFHYHGLEDDLAPLSGKPIYTIVLTHPACGDPLVNLSHEMVEAATDPYPIDISIFPPNWSVSTFSDEIADDPFCGGGTAPIFVNGSGGTPLFTSIRVASYWSNARQRCVNLADATLPAIATVAVSSWGSQTRLNISGSGFGRNGPSNLPDSTLPYIQVKGIQQNWEAGNPINGDKILVRIGLGGWSGQQLNTLGFTSALGSLNIEANNVPGAPLLVWVCNPNSLKCDSHQATAAAGPYDPRLTIFDLVSGRFDAPDIVKVLQGTQVVMTNTVEGTCEPCSFSSVQTLAPGTYTFTQSVSGTVPINKVSNRCQSLPLALAHETYCIIQCAGPPSCACPVGKRSCGAEDGHCLCVPANTQCP